MAEDDDARMNDVEDDEDDSGEEEDDDSDDDDDEEEDQATAAALQEARQRLEESPDDLSAHVELVKLLKQRAELDEVRDARQQMAALFPLPEAVWLEWLSDEERLAESAEELQALQQLSLRACEDYLSIPLWLRYVELTQRLHAPWTAEERAEARPAAADAAAGEAHVREALEKALTAGGLHVSEGPKLWDAYERFELGVLAAADEGAGKKAAGRVRALYRRRLAVPLLDAEECWRRYAAWEAGPLPPEAAAVAGSVKEAQKVHEAARVEARRRRPLELKVSAAAGAPSPWAAEDGEWAAWEQYLQLEGSTDPWRTRCLYERLLVPPAAQGSTAPLCSQPRVWGKYLAFLLQHLPAKPLLLETSARAVRHCPGAPRLWRERLRAMEAAGASAEEV